MDNIKRKRRTKAQMAVARQDAARPPELVPEEAVPEIVIAPKPALMAALKVPPADYFVPPGYTTHVAAYRRNDRIIFTDFKYTAKELPALIEWIKEHLETLPA